MTSSQPRVGKKSCTSAKVPCEPCARHRCPPTVRKVNRAHPRAVPPPPHGARGWATRHCEAQCCVLHGVLVLNCRLLVGVLPFLISQRCHFCWCCCWLVIGCCSLLLAGGLQWLLVDGIGCCVLVVLVPVGCGNEHGSTTTTPTLTKTAHKEQP